MDKFIIKQMETEDEICAKGYVHYKSWHETYPNLVDGEYLSQVTLESCTAIAHRWPNNILVAKVGDQVVGFAAYGPYRDDTLPGYGEIYALYVLAAFQGQKIGYSLMNAAIERLSGFQKIAVWVLKGNDRAIGFYRRCGFRFDGTSADIILGKPNTELRMIFQRT